MAATFAPAIPIAISVSPEIDLLNPQEREILLFDHGIQVKGQSESRHSKVKVPQENQRKEASKFKTPAVITDIVMLRKPSGDFKYLTVPVDAAGEDLLSLPEAVKAQVLDRLALNSRQPWQICCPTGMSS